MPLSPDIAPDQNGEPPSLGELWRRNVGYRLTRPVNVLVMGIDEVPDAEEGSDEALEGRSDTMLLVRLDPTSETVSLLSIPRDTRVFIPDWGTTKINHANMVGGPELAAQVVSGTANGITIDRYIRVSTGAFRELIDLVGGVEVYVPERMYYTDRTQDLYIDLEPGLQVLDGEQAEGFARFRYDEYGDVGRVQRQQQLLQALRDRFMSPAVIPKIPEAIELFQTYIDTNLTLEEMLALVNFGLNLEQDQLRMVMLPGRFSGETEFEASYWIMDPIGRDQIMQDYFDVGAGRTVADSPRSFNRLRIAIQNASDDPDTARDLANYLQEQGFRNVYFTEDWPAAQEQTQIIVQRGALEAAEQLEVILGVGRVVAASTGDLGSDLTIRVGTDWPAIQ
jgi:LCP family protein required for cell wall assembly